MNPALWIASVIAIFGVAASQQPGKRPLDDIGDAGLTISGIVFVDLRQTVFVEGEPITAIISNGLPDPIYAEDRKTDCSILILEKWLGSSWQQVLGCSRSVPAAWIAIGPERVRRVVLRPDRMLVRRGTNPMMFGEGQYRLTFLFRLARTEDAAEIVLRSWLFDIRRQHVKHVP